MAPLPANNTKRFFLDYSTGIHQHTLIMRTGDSVDDAAASAAFDSLLTILAATLHTIDVVGMRSQDKGSTITLPAVYSGTTTFGTGPQSDKTAAEFVSFVGRGGAGHRVKVTMFGSNALSGDDNFRIPRSASTVVADALDNLVATADVWLDISGSAVTWNQYANEGVNAHFQHKFR